MVPADHLLRKIDAVLDLSWLRGEMQPHYSQLGCPSVCPELMVGEKLLQQAMVGAYNIDEYEEAFQLIDIATQ